MYFLTWSVTFNRYPFGIKIIEPTFECLDLLGAHLSGSLEPEEETHEAWDEIHGVAALRIDLNEDMGGKERLLNPLPAVAPALFHALGWTVDRVAGLLEAFGQFLFLAGLGVNHQPRKLGFLAGGMVFRCGRWSGLHGMIVA